LLKQHLDEKIRFEQQVDNSRQYVLPFVERTKAIKPGIRVLEIGCGEGGVLAPFAEKGAFCLGVDLDPLRIELALQFFKNEVAAGNMQFLVKNVYDQDFLETHRNGFDLIILKDAIEHIPDQEKFIPYLESFLKEDGQIFFGFPPWHMPFGGHQQLAVSKLASKLPWYHILPRPLYRAILKAAGETEGKIGELMEIRDTRITIERFERIVKHNNLRVLARQHYLINPIYRYKFGLKPRRQMALVSMLPYLRNYLTTCVYYTVG